MSTAILISGQTRSFSTCLPNLNWFVFRHLKDPHFFLSVADDEQAKDVHLLEGLYPDRVFIEKVSQPDIPEPHPSKAKHAPYAISSPPQAILRQLWALNRVWDFMQETQEKRSGSANVECGFTTFVRCRPDLWFRRMEFPDLKRDLFSMHMERGPDIFVDGPTTGVAYTPWWSACGGVNDRFAIMDEKGAIAYFTAFQKWRSFVDQGCPLHPETIMLEALRTGGVTVHQTLQAVFSTVRLDGSTVGPIEYHGELAAVMQAR